MLWSLRARRLFFSEHVLTLRLIEDEKKARAMACMLYMADDSSNGTLCLLLESRYSLSLLSLPQETSWSR